MRVSSLPNLSELEKRDRRKSSYHLVASKNKLPEDPEEDDDHLYKYLLSTSAGCKASSDIRLQEVKRQLILEIARTEGDTDSPHFQKILTELLTLHNSDFDARVRPRSKCPACLEGMWINLSKPKFPDCLGKNKNGDHMYTLGRMSFGCFSPTNLVCSIQGTFNPVRVVKDPNKVLSDKSVPSTLLEEVKSGNSLVRTYQIVTAFAIEPYDPKFGPKESSPNSTVDHPLEGLLTTYGYVLANPVERNRLAIWFSGGTIEIRNTADASDMRLWRQIFRDHVDRPAPPAPSVPEPPSSPSPRSPQLKFFRLNLGSKSPAPPSPPPATPKPTAPRVVMETDGNMSYSLSELPKGGHDTAYVDVLYLDETIRVVKANTGSLHVMARVPYFQYE